MFNTIVAPVDISEIPMSEKILTTALFYLQHSDCIVHLITIAPANATEEEVEALTIGLMDFSASHISAHEDKKNHLKLMVLKGSPADQILEHSESIDADLIILGRHRTTGNLMDRQPLGSTTVKVSSQAKADVCIMKKI